MHELLIATTGGFMGVTIAGALLLVWVAKRYERYAQHKVAESIHEFHQAIERQSTEAGECLICKHPIERGTVPLREPPMSA